MEGAKGGKRLQQHEVERALKDFCLRGLLICHAFGVSRVPLEGQMRAVSG